MTETRQCQNCKKEFVIEPDDFSFYEKIKVPPPTWCPECRFQRRMSWRNDWHLFRKKDARTGEMIFSLFPNESPVKIYDRDFWYSDQWDPMEYGIDYDPQRPFFEQFKELLHTVPFPAHSMFDVVDCHYCTNANNIKGCYLCAGAGYTEDSAYLIWDRGSKQSFDSHMTTSCELSYGNVNCANCYRTFFSVDCEDSQEVILSKDCVGCNSCFGCVGLRNQSYRIFNEQYTKEEYIKKLRGYNLGSHASFSELKKKAYAFWQTRPQKFIHGRQNVNVSGDYIYESKNAKSCFRVREIEDCKYCQNVLKGPMKDCYDQSNYGDNTELVYDSLIVGTGGSNIKFSSQAFPNIKNFHYCVFCNNSSDLFGCISLRNKHFCILNKQYTKEEYEKLSKKIIEDMRARGEYGNFFPSELSPFPYQATAAYEFFPLSESETKKKGFVWYPTARQAYKIDIENETIPDNIQEINKDITTKVIGCAHKETCREECTGAFKIIEMEFDFCKRMNIPLPRLCPNCRHYSRLALRNAPTFYHRACMCKSGHSHGESQCLNEFETSYAPDRPEIVYCEQCYQAELA